MKRILPFMALLVGCPTATPEPQLQTQAPARRHAEARVSDGGLAEALAEAGEGVDDPLLAELLRDHWRWSLGNAPLYATRLGVRAFDDQVGDGSYEAELKRRKEARGMLERALAIRTAGLSARDAVTQRLFIELLESDVNAAVCEFALWSLSARSNPVTEWNELHELHKIRHLRDAENLLSRYRLIAGSIDDEIARLRLGLDRGLVGNAESTRRIIEMADKQLAQPISEWPMMKVNASAIPGANAEDRRRLADAFRDVVSGPIRDALGRYKALLESELLPAARDEAHSGLVHLPNGGACYRARIGAFTTLPLEAEAIHAIGLEEIAKIDGELTALGAKALGTKTLTDTLGRLRSDKSLYFDSEQAVEDAAASALAEAKERMGDHFGVLPKTDCVIRRIPSYEAPFTTIAYYRPPHTDGSKPGEYFVNTYQPETRPRYEARVLAVHEAIPGHHLQIAIAQELSTVPAFRKHAGFTAYVEGWALYTERQAAEMGMYETDLDRIGVASFDAWRAGRLVVDTGLHAMGWSRGQAKQFLSEHTALSPENIDNEVDRYISWPGQALGYKIGQLEIWKLRRGAEQQLGDRFDIKAFHDVVLTAGAVSLPVLRDRVESYIAATL